MLEADCDLAHRLHSRSVRILMQLEHSCEEDVILQADDEEKLWTLSVQSWPSKDEVVLP